MMQAMQLTQQATDNAFLRRELDGVIKHVAEGVPLCRATRPQRAFSTLLIDIVSVGEQPDTWRRPWIRALSASIASWANASTR